MIHCAMTLFVNTFSTYKQIDKITLDWGENYFFLQVLIRRFLKRSKGDLCEDSGRHYSYALTCPDTLRTANKYKSLEEDMEKLSHRDSKRNEPD